MGTAARLPRRALRRPRPWQDHNLPGPETIARGTHSSIAHKRIFPTSPIEVRGGRRNGHPQHWRPAENYSWETADIAVLVFIYRGRRMIAQKIGMLQTKRMFPKNNDVMDDDPEGFRYGMNAFLKRDNRSPLAVLNRELVFDDPCMYGSLKAESEQIATIDQLNSALRRLRILHALQPDECSCEASVSR